MQADHAVAGNEFTAEDGEYLMGALAINTKATVYAGTRIQWYLPKNFNWGSWEGEVLKFTSDGASPRKVNHVPVEYNDLSSFRPFSKTRK